MIFNDSTELQSNRTTNFGRHFNSTEDLPSWSWSPVFYLIVCICGIICNGTLLSLFIYDRHLRTPFNVYLINLFSANMACLLVQYPLAVLSYRYPSGRWTMGNPACTLYLYCQSVLGAAIISFHALTAINRAWAILQPRSYRTLHSARLAWTLCGAMWVYIHTVEGAFLFADTQWYRVDIATMGCIFNNKAFPQWSNVNCLVVYMLPLCVVLTSCPLVVVNRVLRARQRLNRRVEAGLSIDRRLSRAVSRGMPSAKRDGSNKFTILALLTISVAMCSLPEMIFFLLVGFVPGFWQPTVFQVTAHLYSCQTILDPILFGLALERLQNSLFKLCGPCKPRDRAPSTAAGGLFQRSENISKQTET
ncbi:hypothetical protein BV898_16431 [Hypsibius exemplaris]|uniref:G-protein coupled receptors family 1 profile domain-containing protein n=1 Tax=Hypsibius exemplaris TaxID=2072580 RepID=A0A9X6NFA8_HYPEX|nr:hypothetical protein BV898_16431 [Hypsibius exemplaris]